MSPSAHNAKFRNGVEDRNRVSACCQRPEGVGFKKGLPEDFWPETFTCRYILFCLVLTTDFRGKGAGDLLTLPVLPGQMKL